MAKHTVAHNCGHSETHQIYGPLADRDCKLAWLEGTLCSECYHAAAAATAAEANAAASLPILTGSEKQIAWAESIRQPVAAALLAAEATAIERAASNPAISDQVVLLSQIVAELCGRTSAPWWIESGRDLPQDATGAARWLAEEIVSRIKAIKTTLSEEQVKMMDETKTDGRQARIEAVCQQWERISGGGRYRIQVQRDLVTISQFWAPLACPTTTYGPGDTLHWDELDMSRFARQRGVAVKEMVSEILTFCQRLRDEWTDLTIRDTSDTKNTGF